jgi:hypothetical protein
MRVHSLLTLVGLAIGFAVPTFAQQKGTVDPEVRQQIEAVSMKFQEAFNNRDATNIGETLTEDAVEVRSWQGLASGRQA